MSRRRAYKTDTLSIIGRFFFAIDSLVASGELRGVQTYCVAYGIDRRHLYAQRKDFGLGYFEVAWIVPLVKDYNVSAEWLLMGKGGMLTR